MTPDDSEPSSRRVGVVMDSRGCRSAGNAGGGDGKTALLAVAAEGRVASIVGIVVEVVVFGVASRRANLRLGQMSVE